MFYLLAILLAIVLLKNLSVFYLQDGVQVELCELSNVKFLIDSKIIEVQVLSKRPFNKTLLTRTKRCMWWWPTSCNEQYWYVFE